MRSSQRAITFVADQDTLPARSPNTVLIAAAIACGLRFADERPFLHTLEPLPDGATRRKCIWTLDGSFAAPFRWVEIEGNGRLVPREERVNFATFRARFEDPAWCRDHPDHPIAYVRAAFEQHKRFLDDLKTVPPHIVVRFSDDRFALVPADATPEKRAEILGQI